MNWMPAATYTLQRLQERSTWVGLIGLATAAGITLSPALADHIASAGAALAGLVLVLIKDKPSVVVQPVVTLETAVKLERANG